jgi:hypothetical protein
MIGLGPWNTEDFESLCWHDVHVYGFRLDTFNPEEGSADLIFDIDYILKWDKNEREFQFTVCKAELKFHKTFGLKFMLDYVTPSAGMCPFSIHGIERKPLTFSGGYASFHWSIAVNWPHGSLEFDAPGFTQKLTGKPVVQSGQSLSPEQRMGKHEA